jgi:hypothetical protein
MSYALDVNLLLYASDQRSPFSNRHASFLNDVPFSLSFCACHGWY